MNKEEFLQEVKKEVEAIKRNATKEELSRLSFHMLEHTSKHFCIYGQLTGRCDSERAKEIFSKVYKEVVEPAYEFGRLIPFKHQDFQQDFKLNKFTYLEKWLFMVGSDSYEAKEVIMYLKGEINRLTLTNDI